MTDHTELVKRLRHATVAQTIGQTKAVVLDDFEVLAAADAIEEQAATIAAKDHEIAGLTESAAFLSANSDFYQALVREVGDLFGPDAYISDDGSVQNVVLALKVPVLVKEALATITDLSTRFEAEVRARHRLAWLMGLAGEALCTGCDWRPEEQNDRPGQTAEHAAHVNTAVKVALGMPDRCA